MEYKAPYGSSDPDAPYVDRNTPGAIVGSKVPAAAIEHPQREIANFIALSGITPSDGDLEQLASSARSQRLNYIAAAGGTANALTATLDPPLTFLVSGMPVRILIAATNTGPVTLNVNGLGALPIKTMRGNNIKRGDMPAGAIVTLICAGAAWVLAGVAYSDFRPIASNNLQFYVAPTGSNNNSGESAGQPWQTLQFAWETIRDRIDLNGKTATVNCANGVYTEGLVARGQVLGGTGTGSVVFIGDEANPSNVIVSPAATSAFFSGSRAEVAVRGFNVSGRGASLGGGHGCGILCQGGNIAFQNMRFAQSDIAHIYAQNGVALAQGPITIVNNAVVAFWGAGTGTVQLGGQTVTLTGSYTYTDFVRAAYGSVDLTGVTFTGSAQSGRRWSATASAFVVTSGGGATFIPGSTAGFTDSTSTYS